MSQAVKQAQVVSQDALVPGTATEQLALFNPDGSPYTGGDGAGLDATKVAAVTKPTSVSTADATQVTSANATGASGANPTQAEYAAMVTLVNELKTKVNALVTLANDEKTKYNDAVTKINALVDAVKS